MKQTLLVAVASAAIGAATAVLLTRPTAAPARGPGPARLSTVDLERAFVRALETAGLGRQAPSRPGVSPSERSEPSASPVPFAPGRAVEEPAMPIRGAGGGQRLPEPNRPALQGLRSFKRDVVLRFAWMFRPQRDVIAWLGAPNVAFVVGGGETWVYELPDGTKRVLEFHRGRLLNIRS